MKLVVVVSMIRWKHTGEFYFVSGGSRLHKAAQTINILSARGTSGIGRFPCRIWKSFSLSMALST